MEIGQSKRKSDKSWIIIHERHRKSQRLTRENKIMIVTVVCQEGMFISKVH